MYRVYNAKTYKKAPTYFHSVYGVGIQIFLNKITGLGKKKPSIENRVYLEDQLTMESGEVKDNKELENPEAGMIASSLIYNEFVVYDVAQVRLKPPLM